MATTVHLPASLLAAVDRKARALDVSRNRVIIDAIERDLAAGGDWSEGFFDRLADIDAETADAVAALRAEVVAARRSKRPVRFTKR